MKDIKTSFLIPSYNHALFLNQCLKSVLENRCNNLELLICDDASQDNSQSIIEEWIKLNGSLFDRCIFIKNDKNQGITKTINELISIAKGEIISGVASDDYILPGGIEAKRKYLKSNSNMLGAFSDGIAVGMNGEFYSNSILASSGLTHQDLNPSNIRNTVLNNWIEPMNLQFWRRSSFKSHGGEFEFDGTVFCEDLNFAIWALSKNRFGYLDKKCIAYRCRSWPQVSDAKNQLEIDKKHGDMAKCFDLYKNKYKFRKRKIVLLRRNYYQSLSERHHAKTTLTLKELQKLNQRKSATVYLYTFQRELIRSILKPLKALRTNSIRKKVSKYKNILIIYKSNFLRVDFVSPKGKNIFRLISRYVSNWERKQSLKKPMPGFHPGIYAYIKKIKNEDPFVHYIQNGTPQGQWNFPVITPSHKIVTVNHAASVALQLHIFYPEMAEEIISRLMKAKLKPNLLISVTSSKNQLHISRLLNKNYSGNYVIRVVPNRGRDFGPLFTEFKDEIKKYEFIGHFHTKVSPHLSSREDGVAWYQFLIENIIGGKSLMSDIILATMKSNPSIGLVFPEDPHIFGWDKNYNHAEVLARKMDIRFSLEEHFNFPAGSMFWARTDAVKPLFDLNLDWDDYPVEPIDHDGTMLHAIERLIPFVVRQRGYQIAVSNVPGITY